MASPESKGSFHEVLSELERLVEIGKNLRSSYMNFDSIADLITQKLVGLRALGDDDTRDTSLKDLKRLLVIRNRILDLNICSNRNYGEHWKILDGLLKRTITILSFLHPVDATSDLRCLETLEGWVVLNDQMITHPTVSPEAGSLLNDIVFTRLNTLLETFENGLIVKDDTGSMRVLEIAAKLRKMFHPRYHKGFDKIGGQKLRILSIRQAGKSDVSLLTWDHTRSLLTVRCSPR